MRWTKAIAMAAIALFLLGKCIAPARATEPLASRGSALAASDHADVLGLAFVGRQVSDLEKSMAYYETLGFEKASVSGWAMEPLENRLYGTPGAESRAAILTMASSASGKPMRLILREYRGIPRKNLRLPIYDVGVGHIGVAAESPRAFWEKVKAAGQLRPATRSGDLAATSGADGGFGTMTDPDGMIVEVRKPRPAAPAMGDVPAMPGDRPGFSHFGLVVADMSKSFAFYDGLSGAFPSLPEFRTGRGPGDMWNLPGDDNPIRVVYGTLLEANAPPGTRFYLELVSFKSLGQDAPGLRDARISDIGVNYIGLQVSGLESVYSKLKAAGCKALSDGIVRLKDGTRAVVIRDPNSGLFLELAESPRS